MKTRRRFFLSPVLAALVAVLCLSPLGALGAHHGTGGSSPGAGVFTGGGGAGALGESGSLISFGVDWVRGDRPPPEESVTLGGRSVTPQPAARNLFVSTLFGEYAFNEHVSGNLSVPVIRFDRKEAPDFQRLGRVTLGGRFAPLKDWLPSALFLNGSVAIGLPAGADEGVARGGDFWSGHAGVFLGLNLGRFTFVTGAEGDWPLSRLKSSEPESGLQRLETLLSGTPTSEQDDLVLKKTTRFSGTVLARLGDSIALLAGLSYQDPYNGMVEDRRGEVSFPRVYREARLGAEADIGRVRVGFVYHYPLERGNDRKRYEEIYTFGVTYFFRASGKGPSDGEVERVRENAEPPPVQTGDARATRNSGLDPEAR